MKVLITGASGQLGWELQQSVPAGIELVACDSKALDITAADRVVGAVEQAAPEVIINCAAYTAVDRAEEEEERAFLVNGQGAVNLARTARQQGSRLIHISTDFVFDGTGCRPYLPEDRPGPLGVYGASKHSGEQEVSTIMSPDAWCIVRTAWVYSVHGSNFVKTMLRLMGERQELGIVADQVGTPTWAHGLAEAVWQAVWLGISGTHHWTDAGVASWYDFCVAIMEEAVSLGLLQKPITIKPIRTADYPTPAKRPSYSVLDKTSIWQELGQPAEHWRQALRKMLKELLAAGRKP